MKENADQSIIADENYDIEKGFVEVEQVKKPIGKVVSGPSYKRKTRAETAAEMKLRKKIRR